MPPIKTAINPKLPIPAAAQGQHDRYTASARPTFLYVMYAILLWSIPIGVLGVFSPTAARNMAAAMTGYFAGLPEPLYTLFGAAYLGYTAARQWGKMRIGSDTPRKRASPARREKSTVG
jgi:hypothetical protein